MKDNAEAQLNQGLIQRLGHFRSRRLPGRTRTCRRFSYTIDQRESQLAEVLEAYWTDVARDATLILYDSGTSPWFHQPVATIGARYKVPFFPVSDLEGDAGAVVRQRIGAAGSGGRAVLMVDVVQSGQTLDRHLRTLRRLAIPHVPDVVAGVVAPAAREVLVEGTTYRIWPCVEAEQEVFDDDCTQCRLGLRHTPETEEEDGRQIRPFDFWFMVETCGWKDAEQDPPPGRAPFETVPDFDEIVLRYGGWLGYKMARLIGQDEPMNYAIVYIDQAGAKAVADRLRPRLGDHVSFIAIPERHVVATRQGGQSWNAVFEEARGEPWAQALNDMSRTRAVAVVVDIFNASGGTFRAIYGLLHDTLGIGVHRFLPLLDRDVGRSPSPTYPVQRKTLYEWYGPLA